MRKYHLSAALAALVVGTTALPAQAGSLTLTTGQVDLDEPGFDPATVGSIRLANEILDVGVAEFDLGFEYAQDLDAGETDSGADWGFQSIGLYLSARTAGPLYLIGRVGIAEQEVEIDGGDTNEATLQSIGLGLGASIGILQLELMANEYSGDDELEDITWVSAGIRF